MDLQRAHASPSARRASLRIRPPISANTSALLTFAQGHDDAPEVDEEELAHEPLNVQARLLAQRPLTSRHFSRPTEAQSPATPSEATAEESTVAQASMQQPGDVDDDSESEEEDDDSGPSEESSEEEDSS